MKRSIEQLQKPLKLQRFLRGCAGSVTLAHSLQYRFNIIHSIGEKVKMLYRISLVALLLGNFFSILSIAHPVGILPEFSRVESKEANDNELEYIVTPYGHRKLADWSPKEDTNLSNPLNRIHPITWTAMFGLAAIGLSYWMVGHNQRKSSESD